MRGERLDWQMLIETALTAPGHMGDTYNRFYQYTFLNQLLLLMQGIREPIGTMKTWNALGRSVLKGSKAYQIVRPITIMKKNHEGEVQATFTRFKPVRCIFAYSQTTGAADQVGGSLRLELHPAPMGAVLGQ